MVPPGEPRLVDLGAIMSGICRVPRTLSIILGEYSDVVYPSIQELIKYPSILDSTCSSIELQLKYR
jgi:hypothetical protein